MSTITRQRPGEYVHTFEVCGEGVRLWIRREYRRYGICLWHVDGESYYGTHELGAFDTLREAKAWTTGFASALTAAVELGPDEEAPGPKATLEDPVFGPMDLPVAYVEVWKDSQTIRPEHSHEGSYALTRYLAPLVFNKYHGMMLLRDGRIFYNGNTGGGIVNPTELPKLATPSGLYDWMIERGSDQGEAYRTSREHNEPR